MRPSVNRLNGEAKPGVPEREHDAEDAISATSPNSLVSSSARGARLATRPRPSTAPGAGVAIGVDARWANSIV